MVEIAAQSMWFAPVIMLVAAVFLGRQQAQTYRLVRAWRFLSCCSWAALVVLLGILLTFGFSWWSTQMNVQANPRWSFAATYLQITPLGLILAVLVQFLGTVIIGFSARYLAGEPRQLKYMVAMAGLLAAVQLLLMANHWLVLIALWSAVGFALQHLLCFYQERPFAQLATHKKRIADYFADVLLLGAAVLAWHEVGSGSFSILFDTIAQNGMTAALHWSAVLLVLAVVLRTAALPFHGWLIQVMEAPTPVSALLHAGVVNLGGFVLIRFSSLLEHAMWARSLLLIFGLLTAVLAGMVMLTRVSIKLRLAWSTVAQMGFMLVECAAGLYSLAALHLLGHSLYKAHAFLGASNVVYETRIQQMRGTHSATGWSLLLAPGLSLSLLVLLNALAAHYGWQTWVWWWNAILAFALAPLLWTTKTQRSMFAQMVHLARGISMVLMLAALSLSLHYLPFGLNDHPDPMLGTIAMLGMALLYMVLALIETQSQTLESWRRWSYAGFYIDEWFTRLTLRIWPTNWVRANPSPFHQMVAHSPAVRPSASGSNLPSI